MNDDQAQPALESGVPVTPDNIVPLKVAVAIPSEVIDVVNEMLAAKFVSRKVSIHIKQKDIISVASARMGLDADEGEVFNSEWLNFEPIFREAGWKVNYDKPCYYGGDNYDAFFEFVAE